MKRKQFLCLLLLKQVPICVSNTTSAHAHTRARACAWASASKDRAWTSKGQRMNSQTILLNWYLTQAVTVMFLQPTWQWHVWQLKYHGKEHPSTPHPTGKQGQKMKQMEGTTIKKKNVLRVTTLLPCVKPWNSAWRKQTSATNNRLHHFTGDKPADRLNVFTS